MLIESKNYETTKHAAPVQVTGPIQISLIYISSFFVKLFQNTKYDIKMAYNRHHCFFQ
jgi:hypothetical protein